MLIDWFTVVAQVINFLILVGLLRYFLYGRILSAIDQREQKITERWEKAEQKQKDAEAEARSYRQKQEELDHKRDEVLADARNQGNQRRQELIAQARGEADRMQERWQESLRQEQEEFLFDLRRRIARGTCSITRRVLSDLADDDLQRRVISIFLDRLQALDEPARDDLRNPHGSPSIRSAFEISDDQRQAISNALRDSLGEEFQAEFETDPDLICGLELSADGRKVAWNVEDYLDNLQEQLVSALDREQSGSGEKDQESEDSGLAQSNDPDHDDNSKAESRKRQTAVEPGG